MANIERGQRTWQDSNGNEISPDNVRAVILVLGHSVAKQADIREQRQILQRVQIAEVDQFVVGQDQRVEHGQELGQARVNFGDAVVAEQQRLQSLQQREIREPRDLVVREIYCVILVLRKTNNGTRSRTGQARDKKELWVQTSVTPKFSIAGILNPARWRSW
jgi:hypothetical protein